MLHKTKEIDTYRRTLSVNNTVKCLGQCRSKMVNEIYSGAQIIVFVITLYFKTIDTQL